MTEFLQMGGYGIYVWSSYLVGLVILVANIVIPVYRHKKLRQQIRNQTTFENGQIDETGS